MNELEKLTGSEEVFNTMILTLRELSEDERIRLQCQAREDYERRLSGMFEHGENVGIEKGIQLISDILSGQDDGDLSNKGYSKENIDSAKALIASNIQQ